MSNKPGRAVLMAIKPQYIEAIFDWRKLFEYRRVAPDHKAMHRGVYLYASSPVKMVVGFFMPGNIYEGTPEEIWKKTGKKGGMSKADFMDYATRGGNTRVTAIEIMAAVRLAAEVPLSHYGVERAPQNYCYIHPKKLGDL